jgi:hypothetical protein
MNKARRVAIVKHRHKSKRLEAKRKAEAQTKSEK